MTDRDQELLRGHVESVAETIREYARQIESSDYGDTWTVYAADGEVISDDTQAVDEADAIEPIAERYPGAYAEHNDADEPTVDETPISEYPLAMIDERGRPFEVQICTGGPGISVEAEGLYSARLEGYWGGSRVTLHGDEFSTFLDYFIER